MKKNFTRIALAFFTGFIAMNAQAATGWFSDYIKLNVNGNGVSAPTGWYWIGTDPSYATQFDAANLGTVTSLILDGADMKYWSDTQDRKFIFLSDYECRRFDRNCIPCRNGYDTNRPDW